MAQRRKSAESTGTAQLSRLATTLSREVERSFSLGTKRDGQALASLIRSASALYEERLSRPKRPAGTRNKRTKRELEELEETLLTYVVENPGLKMEELGTGLGMDTRELRRPMAALLERRAVRRTGQKRATRYFKRGR